jgi:hypothetical protein
VIAQAIITASLALAALLPLMVTVYALRRLPNNEGIGEILEEVFREQLHLEGGDRLKLGATDVSRIGHVSDE